MSKEEKEILRVRYKMLILDLEEKFGNVAKTCRDFNVTIYDDLNNTAKLT